MILLLRSKLGFKTPARIIIFISLLLISVAINIYYKTFTKRYAFDNMIEWSDFTSEVPNLDENIWERSDKLPIIGEVRVVKVTDSFNFTIGEQFNVMFIPALAANNGWDSYPKQISESAIVFCEFSSILQKSDYSAWIKVVIKNVIMLNDICNQIPQKKSKATLIKYIKL